MSTQVRLWLRVCAIVCAVVFMLTGGATGMLGDQPTGRPGQERVELAPGDPAPTQVAVSADPGTPAQPSPGDAAAQAIAGSVEGEASVSSVVANALISYQGTLYDASDQPVTGTRNMVAAIYDNAGATTPLWSETHNNVQVRDGHFNIMLGAATPINPAVVFSGDVRYIGLNVDGTEMNPRQRFAAVPYAVSASYVTKLSAPDGTHALVVDDDGSTTIYGAENDGGPSALTIQSPNQKMSIDGNEIDSYAANGLWLNNNAETDVHIAHAGGETTVHGPLAVGSDLYVNRILPGDPDNWMFINSWIQGAGWQNTNTILAGDGNVGIGPFVVADAPTAKLDVKGDARIRGEVKVGYENVKPVLIKRVKNAAWHSADGGHGNTNTTGVSADDYECVACGWSAQFRPYTAGEKNWMIWTYLHDDGTWWWVADLGSVDGAGDCPDFDIICFRKEIADWQGMYGATRELDEPN